MIQFIAHNLMGLVFQAPQQSLTILDIADTAVKIGLGAIISGFATYLITKEQHKESIENEHRKRRAQILVEAAEQIENINHVYLKYASVTRTQIRAKRDGSAIPTERQDNRERIKEELFLAFKEITSAEAKLMLIGENTSSKLCRDFAGQIATFRSTVTLDEPLMSDAEIDSSRDVILAKRKELFDALSQAFRNS